MLKHGCSYPGLHYLLKNSIDYFFKQKDNNKTLIKKFAFNIYLIYFALRSRSLRFYLIQLTDK